MDVDFLGPCRRYAAENAKQWYQFVNGTLGAEVPNGHLYFITGADTTSHWGTSAWHGQTTGVNVSLKFGACLAQASAGLVYRWEEQNSAAVCSHPDPNDVGEPLWNQSVFVRGIRVALPETRLGTKLFRTKVVTSQMDQLGDSTLPSKKCIPFSSTSHQNWRPSRSLNEGSGCIQGPSSADGFSLHSIPDLAPAS